MLLWEHRRALLQAAVLLTGAAALQRAWRRNQEALANEQRARAELEETNRDLVAAQALSHMGSWDYSPATGAMWWSDELHGILGREPGAVQPDLQTFLDHVTAADRPRVEEQLRSLDGEMALEFEIERPDGSRRTLHALSELSRRRDGPPRVLGTCQDITERKALEAEVSHRALHDELTGLANRWLFLDRLEHAVAHHRRTGTPLALLYLDMDDFKTVNDSLGHSMGDELLIDIGWRLRGALRASDTVARLGGDEFAVLAEDTDVQGAVTLADTILDVLRQPLQVADTMLRVRTSIGIATTDSGDPEHMLRHADIAMYAAKRGGTHAYRVFNAGMQSSLTARLRLEAELAEALDREQLVLHYQPIVALESGRVEGVEALVRWEHPSLGLLPPSEFIPIAEQMGHIPALGEWVLHQALRDTKRLQDALGTDLTISVNTAAAQLQTDLAGTVRSALSSADVSPDHLVLEITETCVMTQEQAIVDKLADLRVMGVRIAIDDFGTGYSSLAYLRRLPIDQLKIDRAFVRDLALGPEESALAHAIVKLGSLFGLEVVAEGIETPQQSAILQRMGCHSGQGYLYHRPTDIESLLARMLRTRGAARATTALTA